MKNNKMMEYLGYHAKAYYDPDDKIIIGEIVGINDDLSFHATTTDEFEEMFHQSVDNYLDMCKLIGKEPEKEYKGSFNVRLSPELHKAAAIQAAAQEITLNQYVIRSVEHELNDTHHATNTVYILSSEKKDKISLDNINLSSQLSEGFGKTIMREVLLQGGLYNVKQ